MYGSTSYTKKYFSKKVYIGVCVYIYIYIYIYIYVGKSGDTSKAKNIYGSSSNIMN